MKNKFLKFFAVLACFVMIFSMTAFAADSPSTGDNSGTPSPDTSNNSGSTDSSNSTGSTDSNGDYSVPATDMASGVTAPKITINGQELTVTISTVSVADVKNAQAQAKAFFGENATVLKVFDISLPEGDYSAGVDVTLNIPEIKAGQSVSVIHWNGQVWENLPVTNVSEGSVTATFTSFSPVAVVINPLITAPSTGFNTAYFVVAAMVLALAGAVFFVRRGYKAE